MSHILYGLAIPTSWNFIKLCMTHTHTHTHTSQTLPQLPQQIKELRAIADLEVCRLYRRYMNMNTHTLNCLSDLQRINILIYAQLLQKTYMEYIIKKTLKIKCLYNEKLKSKSISF